MLARNQSIRYSTFSKISAQPHTTLCIQFLDRENNDKSNTLPLVKQICFTLVWGSVEILPNIHTKYPCVLTCSPKITKALNFWAASKTKPEFSQKLVIGPLAMGLTNYSTQNTSMFLQVSQAILRKQAPKLVSQGLRKTNSKYWHGVSITYSICRCWWCKRQLCNRRKRSYRQR